MGGDAARRAAEAGVDPAAFRQVLGHYATGVVVVACMLDGRPYGLAVNSFTSVSLDPPLVAFCAARTSGTWPSVRAAGRFTVSVLADVQREVCARFAAKGADRFSSVEWTASPSGHPVLAGCIAWLDCTVAAVHRAGDHDLVLATVTALGAGSGEPLLFFRGRYARLAPAADAPTGAERWTVDATLVGGIDVDSPFSSVIAARLGQSAAATDSRSISPGKSQE